MTDPASQTDKQSSMQMHISIFSSSIHLTDIHVFMHVFQCSPSCDWLQNKSAFLCGVMKTYRQREKQGNKVQESTKGPDETKIKVQWLFHDP